MTRLLILINANTLQKLYLETPDVSGSGFAMWTCFPLTTIISYTTTTTCKVSRISIIPSHSPISDTGQSMQASILKRGKAIKSRGTEILDKIQYVMQIDAYCSMLYKTISKQACHGDSLYFSSCGLQEMMTLMQIIVMIQPQTDPGGRW